MSRAEAARRIREAGTVAIVRRRADLDAVIAALVAGGMQCIEIPLGVEGALGAIERAARAHPEICIGAGTALNADDVRRASEAGARYVLSPVLDPDVIGAAHELDLVAVPGAMTPTELYAGFRAGAEIIKLFPASSLGPGYLKDLMVPLPMLSVMAVGGVTIDSVPEWLGAGACAVGLGSPLVGNEGLGAITDKARRLAQVIAEARACAS